MNEMNRRRALLVGAAGAANIVLIACGGSSDDDAADPSDAGGSPTTGSPSTGSPSTGSPSTGGTAVSTPVGEAIDGVPPIGEYDLDAVLSFTWGGPLTTFDPHRAASSYDNAFLQQTYDPLFRLDQAGSPIAGLATGWEFAPDGSHLDITIGDGVLFHDGTVLDAAAVKANLERAKTLEGSAVTGELAVVSAVEVTGPTTIRLVLSEQAAQLPAVLSDRAGMMVSPAAFENPDLDVAPVGSGMFTVTSYEPGVQVTFARFADYWDPDVVRCAGMEWPISTDSTTRFNALRTGQTDGTILGAVDDAEAESAGLNVVRNSGLDFYHLQLNRTFEPFADADVRRAMNHAIDRQGIVDSVLYGLGRANSQIFPEGYFAFDSELGADALGFDQERARELLDTAGYGDGFEFDLLYQAAPSSEILATAVQAMLAEVGITANPVAIEPAQAAERFYLREEGHAMAVPWGGRPDPTQTLRLLFTAEGFSNPGRHSTDAVEAAAADTAVVRSDAERTAACQAASAAVVADALDVVVYNPISSYGFTPDVLVPEGWGFGRPDFRYVGKRKA